MRKMSKRAAAARLEAMTMRIEMRVVDGVEIPCRILVPHGDYACHSQNRHIPKTHSLGPAHLWSKPEDID